MSGTYKPLVATDEVIRYKPDLGKKYLPAMEFILTEVVSQSRGRYSLDAFGRDVLPYLMSEDPEEQELGRQRHFAIANGIPFNEIELYDETGRTVCVVPPMMAKIPSMKGRPDEFSPMMEARAYFSEAKTRDMMFGLDPDSPDSNTHQVYNGLANAYRTVGDLSSLIAWDQIVTYFGYPSYFTPEERADLIARGLTFEWDKQKTIKHGEEYHKQEATIKQEDTYDEDDWEV